MDLAVRRASFNPIALAWVLLVALPSSGRADDDDEATLNQIVVTATRIAGLIRDEPLRVEAVPADEIEENLTEQPGNLSSLLHEMPRRARAIDCFRSRWRRAAAPRDADAAHAGVNRWSTAAGRGA